MKKSLASKVAIGFLAGLGLIGSGCAETYYINGSKVFTPELDQSAWVMSKADSSKFFGFERTIVGCAISMKIDSSKVSYYFPREIDKKLDKFIKRKSFNFLEGDIFEIKPDRTLIIYDVKPYLTRDSSFYKFEGVKIDYINYTPSDSLGFNKAKERMKFLMNEYYSLKDSIALKLLK